MIMNLNLQALSFKLAFFYLSIDVSYYHLHIFFTIFSLQNF